MKKLALLLVLTIVLAFSFTYATDTTVAPDNATPAISGEVIEDNTVVDTNKDDVANTDISGNDIEDTSTPVSGDEAEHDHDHNTELTTSKSTVWGAVLAIVIVIAVVAVVAVFSKND